MKSLRALASAAVLLAWIGSASAQSPWTPVTKPFPGTGAGVPLLLTDGRVLVKQEQSSTDAWYTLTPDATGSYKNGTWKQVSSIPAAFNYSPLFFSSQVLADGRVTVEGGEYNFLSAVWTNKGAIYDPAADKWTQVAPPNNGQGAWTNIGDAESVMLDDGTWMMATCCAISFDGLPPEVAYFNPSNLTWSTHFNGGKKDEFDEEGFTKLPNGKVLVVDAYVNSTGCGTAGKGAEIFNPATKTWSCITDTPAQMWDNAGHELGSAALMNDGRVFQVGAVPATAIYTPSSNSWVLGPTPSGGNDQADGPGAVLRNGNVLEMMSPGLFTPPSSFFEFDGTNLNLVTPPPNAANDSSFVGHFLVLPTGEVMLTDYSTVVELYHATSYNAAWAPQIFVPYNNLNRGTTYPVYGYRLAGMNQGSYYGDDLTNSTNYALVRITNNATGHVFYCKTHNPSSYALQSTAIQSTHFDVPAAAETGPSILEAVTNGIPSPKVNVIVH